VPVTEATGNTGKGMNNPNTKIAANMGNKVHYDELNGGKGQGLPTELSKKYPDTEFEFSRRGQAGVDVKVVGGKHPSQYPSSAWKPGNDYADFKPGTASGQKTFQSDINKGKIPGNSEYLPYEPQNGHLK